MVGINNNIVEKIKEVREFWEDKKSKKVNELITEIAQELEVKKILARALAFYFYDYWGYENGKRAWFIEVNYKGKKYGSTYEEKREYNFIDHSDKYRALEIVLNRITEHENNKKLWITDN